MNTGGGFVKAYSNNWLSQFGLYKYENPVDPPRKPAPYQTQHRKIALYGILGMAFVLFFILFVIINQSEADKRLSRLEIARSFSNETSIESSLGRGTLLTTPFSAPEAIEGASAEARKQRRSRRLGNIGNVPDPVELNENLVLFPSSYLKPPRPGSMQQFAEDRSLKETVRDKPRPFGYSAGGENPTGFSKPNRTLEDSELGQSLKHYGMTNNIQDVLKQLSSSREQRYKSYPQQQQQQPSEFSNPAYRNHRVKFTGIYRHPRKNGDITTLFGAASRQHELQLTKPQVINSQLAVPNTLMPDSLYNFRPSHPSDVNLLASEQFRFAPENNPNTVENLPKGMPFSIMLDILPMAAGAPNNRFKRPNKRKPSGHNYSNVNFPSYFNNRNFAQVKHALYNNHQHSEPNTYYRSSTNNYQRQLQNFFPTMKPGKLMVHLNLYPKQPEADRKFELEKSSLNINHLQLNFGENLPDPERHKAEPTQSSVRNYLDMISRSAEEYITSTSTTTTTTTELPFFVSSYQSPTSSSFFDRPKNITFPNEHVAMGRYPPYGRQVKRRLQHPNHLHHLQEINWELEPRGVAPEELSSPVEEDTGPERFDVVRFDESDAI